MKRFRIFRFDLDTRVHSLTTGEQEHWDECAKECHRESREQTRRALVWEFGEEFAEEKEKNFIALGPKPVSIFAFHNRFLHQIRTSFVVGGYYPALTAACALGERMLNHLILLLRDDFKATPEYKRVCNKQSFRKWDVAINTLADWEVLLPAVVTEFRKLRDRRNDAIHFRPEVDINDRPLALGAINSLGSIVGNQFSAFGAQPWFITTVPGEIYIKKDWEDKPFVRRVYLPNCAPVGPKHTVESVMPWIVRDDYEYDQKEITDEEFSWLRLREMQAPNATKDV
jgi:hypothetical protein